MSQTIVQPGFAQKVSDRPIVDAQWSPVNPNHFIMASSNKVELVDTQSNARQPLGMHQHYVTGVTVCQTAGLVASSGIDGFVRLWDLRTNQQAGEIGLGAAAVALDCLGDDLVAATTPGCLHWITPSQRMKQAEFRTQGDRPFDIPLLCVSVARPPLSRGGIDTTHAIAGRADMRCQVWYKNEPARQGLSTTAFKGAENYVMRPVLKTKWQRTRHASQINTITRDPEGHCVTGSGCGSIRTWNIPKKQVGAPSVISESPTETAPITALAVTGVNNMYLYAYAEGNDWTRGAAGASGYNAPKTALTAKLFNAPK